MNGLDDSKAMEISPGRTPRDDGQDQSHKKYRRTRKEVATLLHEKKCLQAQIKDLERKSRVQINQDKFKLEGFLDKMRRRIPEAFDTLKSLGHELVGNRSEEELCENLLGIIYNLGHEVKSQAEELQRMELLENRSLRSEKEEQRVKTELRATSAELESELIARRQMEEELRTAISDKERARDTADEHFVGAQKELVKLRVAHNMLGAQHKALEQKQKYTRSELDEAMGRNDVIRRQLEEKTTVCQEQTETITELSSKVTETSKQLAIISAKHETAAIKNSKMTIGFRWLGNQLQRVNSELETKTNSCAALRFQNEVLEVEVGKLRQTLKKLESQMENTTNVLKDTTASAQQHVMVIQKYELDKKALTHGLQKTKKQWRSVVVLYKKAKNDLDQANEKVKKLEIGYNELLAKKRELQKDLENFQDRHVDNEESLAKHRETEKEHRLRVQEAEARSGAAEGRLETLMEENVRVNEALRQIRSLSLLSIATSQHAQIAGAHQTPGGPVTVGDPSSQVNGAGADS